MLMRRRPPADTLAGSAGSRKRARAAAKASGSWSDGNALILCRRATELRQRRSPSPDRRPLLSPTESPMDSLANSAPSNTLATRTAPEPPPPLVTAQPYRSVGAAGEAATDDGCHDRGFGRCTSTSQLAIMPGLRAVVVAQRLGCCHCPAQTAAQADGDAANLLQQQQKVNTIAALLLTTKRATRPPSPPSMLLRPRNSSTSNSRSMWPLPSSSSHSSSWRTTVPCRHRHRPAQAGGGSMLPPPAAH